MTYVPNNEIDSFPVFHVARKLFIEQSLPEVHDVSTPIEGTGGKANITLSKEQEKTFFLRYNFARKHNLVKTSSKLESLGVAYNRGIIGKFVREEYARGIKQRFTHIYSDHLLVVLRCIRGFDVSKDLKFSTYLWKAFLRHRRRFYIQDLPKERVHDQQVTDKESLKRIVDDSQSSRMLRLPLNMLKDAGLTLKEQDVVKVRLGFSDRTGTITELAAAEGVSKQSKSWQYRNALKKLRAYFGTYSDAVDLLSVEPLDAP